MGWMEELAGIFDPAPPGMPTFSAPPKNVYAKIKLPTDRDLKMEDLPPGFWVDASGMIMEPRGNPYAMQPMTPATILNPRAGDLASHIANAMQPGGPAGAALKAVAGPAHAGATALGTGPMGLFDQVLKAFAPLAGPAKEKAVPLLPSDFAAAKGADEGLLKQKLAEVIGAHGKIDKAEMLRKKDVSTLVDVGHEGYLLTAQQKGLIPEGWKHDYPTVEDIEKQFADLLEKIPPASIEHLTPSQLEGHLQEQFASLLEKGAKADPLVQVPFDPKKTYPPAPFTPPAGAPAEMLLASDYALKHPYKTTPKDLNDLVSKALLEGTPIKKSDVTNLVEVGQSALLGILEEKGLVPEGWIPTPVMKDLVKDKFKYVPPESGGFKTKKAERVLYPDDPRIPQTPPDPDLPMGSAERMQRMVEQGYKTDMPLVTGVPAWGDPYVTFKDPTKGKGFENAIFATDLGTSDIATIYNQGQGALVPFYVAPKNPRTIDWSASSSSAKTAYDPEYYGSHMNKIIEKALAEGVDFMTLKNIKDAGGMQNQHLVFDPSIMRSPFARFDPKYKGMNDLTAALAAALGLPGAAMMLMPDEGKP